MRDPTHTTVLRNQFARAMGKRFRDLRGIIRRAIIDQDCFGLLNNNILAQQNMYNLPPRRAFDFPTAADKLDAFTKWLDEQSQLFFQSSGEAGLARVGIGDAPRDIWTNTYIRSAYREGIVRGRSELKKARYPVPAIEEAGGIEAAFNFPIHSERVALLYTRTYNDLKGITNAMDTQISRILAKGLADGENPNKLAKLLTRTIKGPSGDLGITDSIGRYIPPERRAKMLARTEIIRAHGQGTLNEYERWGAEGVDVMAEWVTAGDSRVCSACWDIAASGPYTIQQARDMHPYHPLCRCALIPLKKENNKK